MSIMFISNNKVISSSPNLISTVGDIPEESRTIITPYGNKYSVDNFGYQFSNPLVLPFDVELNAVVYGNISLSTTTVKSDVFVIESEKVSKVTITGNGTAFLWYRYGKIDPASFNVIMTYAIANDDYLLADGLLHTLSINEAISYVLQNPEIQEMVLKGMDWQFNKIGFNDFISYLNGGKYDIRRLALFLTISTYVFPCVFNYTSIPVFSGKPLQVYLMYLQYLDQFGQVITSEIETLFSETSELFTQTSDLSERLDFQQAQIAILLAEDEILSSEVDYLSEQSIYHQSEINALSSELAQCCPNLLEVVGKTISQLLMTVDEINSTLVKTVLGLVKRVLAITGVLSGLTNTVLPKLGINPSEIYYVLSEVTVSLWNLSSETVTDVTGLLGGLTSDVLGSISPLLTTTIGGVSEVLGGVDNLLTNTVSDVTNTLGDTLDGVLNVVNSVLPIINIQLTASESSEVSISSSDSSESSNSSGSSSSSSSGGLLGVLGNLL